MNEKPIIEVRNLGKKYSIQHMKGGYVALRDVIATVMRRPFSFLKYKAKRAVGLEKREEFWALRGVDFSIQRGEVVGVIGANGAGKSTLLKILSQITPPTEGEVILRGRVGSLLEVGTGFHPELTGRENIFLNGAILGMKKREIAAKFDEIVAFAGIEKFLDTPVKHYSSGMYVRLAFSVAAHMEPDILLVDEVLAVGDAEFQKKCLGKMDEITKKDGRTILFVSHNLVAIKDICTKSILLEQGRVVAMGATEDIIEQYQQKGTRLKAPDLRAETNRGGDGRIRFVAFHTENENGEQSSTFESGKSMHLVLSYECGNTSGIRNADIGLTILKNSVPIYKTYSSYSRTAFDNLSRKGTFRFRIDQIPFSEGIYDVGTHALVNGIEADNPKHIIGSFEITNPSSYIKDGHRTHPLSAIILSGDWSHEATK